MRCGFLTIPTAPELSMRGICGICRIIGPTTEWLHHISTNSSFFPLALYKSIYIYIIYINGYKWIEDPWRCYTLNSKISVRYMAIKTCRFQVEHCLQIDGLTG